MRLQPMADHPEMLALIVEKAMERCGLAEYGPLVHCGTPNFATIPRTAATKLASQMEESYTVSHSRAWQKKLDAGPFLVKLYQAHGKNWQIAIVSIGCHVGLRTTGGTQGVGRATTNAVVAASVTVLVLDFFITRLMITLFY